MSKVRPSYSYKVIDDNYILSPKVADHSSTSHIIDLTHSIDPGQSSAEGQVVNSIDASIGGCNLSKLCVQTNKASDHFVSVFDNLLQDEWCSFAYETALSRSEKPWGDYNST